MSKRIVILLTIHLAILLCFLPTTYADEAEVDTQATYIFPRSLQKIEEDAFSGTAAEVVIFPDGFLHIEENAFSGAWNLTDVYIPESTEYIADSAFSGTQDLTIHGIDGSYAKEWAEEHQVPFVADNIWAVLSRSGSSLNEQGIPTNQYTAAVNPEKMIAVHERSDNEIESKRPQDRPELNPIDYRFP